MAARFNAEETREWLSLRIATGLDPGPELSPERDSDSVEYVLMARGDGIS